MSLQPNDMKSASYDSLLSLEEVRELIELCGKHCHGIALPGRNNVDVFDKASHRIAMCQGFDVVARISPPGVKEALKNYEYYSTLLNFEDPEDVYCAYFSPRGRVNRDKDYGDVMRHNEDEGARNRYMFSHAQMEAKFGTRLTESRRTMFSTPFIICIACIATNKASDAVSTSTILMIPDGVYYKGANFMPSLSPTLIRPSPALHLYVMARAEICEKDPETDMEKATTKEMMDDDETQQSLIYEMVFGSTPVFQILDGDEKTHEKNTNALVAIASDVSRYLDTGLSGVIAAAYVGYPTLGQAYIGLPRPGVVMTVPQSLYNLHFVSIVNGASMAAASACRRPDLKKKLSKRLGKNPPEETAVAASLLKRASDHTVRTLDMCNMVALSAMHHVAPFLPDSMTRSDGLGFDLITAVCLTLACEPAEFMLKMDHSNMTSVAILGCWSNIREMFQGRMRLVELILSAAESTTVLPDETLDTNAHRGYVIVPCAPESDRGQTKTHYTIHKRVYNELSRLSRHGAELIVAAFGLRPGRQGNHPSHVHAFRQDTNDPLEAVFRKMLLNAGKQTGFSVEDCDVNCCLYGHPSAVDVGPGVLWPLRDCQNRYLRDRVHRCVVEIENLLRQDDVVCMSRLSSRARVVEDSLRKAPQQTVDWSLFDKVDNTSHVFSTKLGISCDADALPTERMLARLRCLLLSEAYPNKPVESATIQAHLVAPQLTFVCPACDSVTPAIQTYVPLPFQRCIQCDSRFCMDCTLHMAKKRVEFGRNAPVVCGDCRLREQRVFEKSKRSMKVVITAQEV